METLTHWKRYRNPDYFGAYCFNYSGEERILTIKMARKETIKGSDGKKQECLVVHWAENEKPFIINATNAKAITKVAKTPYVERWVGDLSYGLCVCCIYDKRLFIFSPVNNKAFLFLAV